jgi:hypothetical protein
VELLGRGREVRVLMEELEGKVGPEIYLTVYGMVADFG